MLISSPDDRAALWSRLGSEHDPNQRDRLLETLATAALEELRSQFDLYADYEEPFVNTVKVLDRCGVLLDDEMLRLYQSIALDETQGGRKFFATILERLDGLRFDPHADPNARLEADELFELWRDHVAFGDPPMLTAAEVAKRYGVVVQTVYKWIDAGKVKAVRSPGGGSIRINARQFASRDLDTALTRAAVHALEPGTVSHGRPRRLNQDVRPAYADAVSALDEGRLPALPRRRYLADRAELEGALTVGPPKDSHVEELARQPHGQRARKQPYKPKHTTVDPQS